MVGPAIAVGLLFACYRIGGSWFDVARVDMLALALLFAGLVLARTIQRPMGAVVAASAMILAILTKQSVLPPALAVVPWLWSHERRLARVYIGTFAFEGIVAYMALQLATHGWFGYYIWTVPSGHAIEHGAIIGFWSRDLASHLWPALLLVVVAFVMTAHDAERIVWFHAPVFGALLFASYSARLHTGGWDNVLIPAYVGVAVLAGIAVGRARAVGRPRPRRFSSEQWYCSSYCSPTSPGPSYRRQPTLLLGTNWSSRSPGCQGRCC